MEKLGAQFPPAEAVQTSRRHDVDFALLLSKEVEVYRDEVVGGVVRPCEGHPDGEHLEALEGGEEQFHARVEGGEVVLCWGCEARRGAKRLVRKVCVYVDVRK